MFSESTEERLNILQQKITDKGIEDIKVTWHIAESFTQEEAAKDLCDVLESYFAKNYKTLDLPINKST